MMSAAGKRLPQNHVIGCIGAGVDLNGFTTIEGTRLDKCFFQNRKQPGTGTVITGKYNMNDLGQEISPFINQAP